MEKEFLPDLSKYQSYTDQMEKVIEEVDSLREDIDWEINQIKSKTPKNPGNFEATTEKLRNEVGISQLSRLSNYLLENMKSNREIEPIDIGAPGLISLKGYTQGRFRLTDAQISETFREGETKGMATFLKYIPPEEVENSFLQDIYFSKAWATKEIASRIGESVEYEDGSASVRIETRVPNLYVCNYYLPESSHPARRVLEWEGVRY